MPEETQDLKKVDKALKESQKNEDEGAMSKPIDFGSKKGEKALEFEKKIIADLMGRFNRWESWRSNYEDTWDEIYKLYINQVQASKTPTRSKISVPVVFQIIESAVPKIVNAVFSSEESFFEVIPTNPADTVEGEMIQMLLEYQLAQADFFSKFIDFTKQLLLYGTSYFKVYWKTERKWVWTRTPLRKKDNILAFFLGEKLEWEEKKEYKIVTRRPEMEVLDILDVYPDPEARTEKDSEGIFIRSWVDKDRFKEMGQGRFPIYANVDRPEINDNKNTFSESRATRTSARGNSNGATSPNQVELLEFWGYYDVDGDGIREEALITIANRSVIVQAKGNPFHHQKRPIVRTVLFPVPLEWFGIGLVEPIISMKHELDTLRRQRLDNVNQALNKMWKVSTLADVDLDSLISAPDNVILTDDMKAVEPLETNDVTGSAYTEAQIVRTDIEDATAPRSI
jgi:hypothetical protein